MRPWLQRLCGGRLMVYPLAPPLVGGRRPRVHGVGGCMGHGWWYIPGRCCQWEEGDTVSMVLTAVLACPLWLWICSFLVVSHVSTFVSYVSTALVAVWGSADSAVDGLGGTGHTEFPRAPPFVVKRA